MPETKAIALSDLMGFPQGQGSRSKYSRIWERVQSRAAGQHACQRRSWGGAERRSLARVCNRCGIIADARPNWREQPARETLTRGLTIEQRRVLQMLAGSPNGCTEPALRAHGFAWGCWWVWSAPGLPSASLKP
jgi:hypothetical protein